MNAGRSDRITGAPCTPAARGSAGSFWCASSAVTTGARRACSESCAWNGALLPGSQSLVSCPSAPFLPLCRLRDRGMVHAGCSSPSRRRRRGGERRGSSVVAPSNRISSSYSRLDRSRRLSPARDWNARTRKSAVAIFAHGNHETIASASWRIESTRSMGTGLLLAMEKVDPSRIDGIGLSPGGGGIRALSRRRPLAAMVLISSLASLDDIAADLRLPGGIVRERFDNIGALRRFSDPSLILNGSKDRLVPPGHARRLRHHRPEANSRSSSEITPASIAQA